MAKIRILAVDDSVVVRQILTTELNKDPDLEVVAVAANGLIALSKIPQVNPDIVIMDINMPEMDGLTATSEIRKIYPLLPVVILSSLTKPSALATLEALSRGANDYVTKPDRVTNKEQALRDICKELILKIKVFCRKVLANPVFTERPLAKRPDPRSFSKVQILAIGVSTGGPNALTELIPALSADFPVPIVIVQHMPPIFTKMLADRLAAASKIPVVEAVSGDVLQPSKVWVAPGGQHMIVEKNGQNKCIRLHEDPPENSCRPSVDVLFRSVAAQYGAHVLGLVLTGMGEDGKRGSQQIVDSGGSVIAQDEASSVVWGMPGAIVKAGLAAGGLPLSQIAEHLLTVCEKT